MTDTAHLDIDTVSEHTKQWLEKAVICLNLCPFAKAPHVKNLVRIWAIRLLRNWKPLYWFIRRYSLILKPSTKCWKLPTMRL